MVRGSFRSLVLLCSVALFACTDAGTLTDVTPSFDRKTVDPPQDFTTLLPGQLKLPAGALPIAQATIGPEGGTVTLNGLPKDGQPTYHRLVVPPNAVAQPTLFTMVLGSSTTVEVDLFAYRRASNGRWENVGAAGFRVPVYLELSYAWATRPVDPAKLGVVYLVGNRVRERMPARANEHAKQVVGTLRHFCRYAVDID